MKSIVPVAVALWAVLSTSWAAFPIPSEVYTMDKLAAARVLGTTHAPAELNAQMLERTRKEIEAEADTLATEILGTADCAPGPCAAFGRLLAAVRR